MTLSPAWLDELKSRITLSALVQRTVKLQRAGREWRACCPFHSEKSPSFYVNDSKGFYHCFGCQQHGGAIDWMMAQHGLQFMDAVKELAAQAGMDMPAPDPREAQRAQQRAGLHDVMAAAQEWFVDNLWSADGAEARAYLERRGLGEAMIRRFGFGWAPDSKQAITRALSRFDEPLLIEAGLLIAVDEKLPYARFRGRVMLPIQDPRERVIAFGGRVLASQDGVAKYLNSPDTPLFDKGRTLYNLHRAAQASRKTGRVVVVEGYMDVVALAAAGFEDAVAPMGTALTEAQIELLWRMADKPVLCFDGDAAGQRAAMRAAERALPLLRPGYSLQVVHLPAGIDPDDLIKRDGPRAMERLLESPQSLLEMIWQHERVAAPLASPEDKAGLKARLLAHVEAIQHPDIRALYRRELLDSFSAFAFPPREPRAARSPSRRQQPESTSPQVLAMLRKARGGKPGDMLTNAVLNGLALWPSEISRHADALLALGRRDAQLGAVVNFLLDHAERLESGRAVPISAPDILPPPPDKTRFAFLDEGCDPDDARQDLAEAVSLLVERPALDSAIAAATRRFESDPEGAFAEQQRLRKRKLEIDSRLGQMARRRASSQAQEQQGYGDVDRQTAEQETD